MSSPELKFKTPRPNEDADALAAAWQKAETIRDPEKRQKFKDGLYAAYHEVMEEHDQPINKERSPLNVAVGAGLEAVDYGPGLIRTGVAGLTGVLTEEDIRRAVFPDLQPAISFSEVAERLKIPPGPTYKGVSARGAGAFLLDVLSSPTILKTLGKKALTKKAVSGAAEKLESVPQGIRGKPIPGRPAEELAGGPVASGGPTMEFSQAQIPGPQSALPRGPSPELLDIPRPMPPSAPALEYQTLLTPPPLLPEVLPERAMQPAPSPQKSGLPYREAPKKVAGEGVGEGISRPRTKYSDMWDMEELVSAPELAPANKPIRPGFPPPPLTTGKPSPLELLAKGAAFVSEPLPKIAKWTGKKSIEMSYKDVDLTTLFAGKTPYTTVATKYGAPGGPKAAALWAGNQIEKLSQNDLRYYIRQGIYEGGKKGISLGESAGSIYGPALDDLGVQMRVMGSSESATKVLKNLKTEMASSGIALTSTLDMGELLMLKRAAQQQARKYGAYAAEGKSLTAKRSIEDQMTGNAYANIANRADQAIVVNLEKAQTGLGSAYKEVNSDISSLLTAEKELQKIAGESALERIRRVSIPAAVGAAAGYSPMFLLPGPAKLAAIPLALATGAVSASPTIQTAAGRSLLKYGPAASHLIRAAGVETGATYART